MTWQPGVCWGLAVGTVLLLAWAWEQNRLSLRCLILAGIFALVTGRAALFFWGSGWGWSSLGLLVGVGAVAIYLASGGEEKTFHAALKRELQVLERQASENPTDAEARVAVGEILQRLRRYPGALRHYQQAAALAPRNLEYQQKVKQLQHIIAGMGSRVRACPTCNAPVHGSEFACPRCGEVVDEYLYAAHRFGREQYLLVAGTALGTLLAVFALGAMVGWRPGWLVGALVASGFAFVMIVLMHRSRGAHGGG